MLKIWGRANSVNVQKVLWCCDELQLPYERIDAGLHHGRNNEPEYLAMNPNGRVPTLEDGDFVLWESNAILRYLALQYGQDSGLYPQGARARGSMERWLDWTLASLQPAERPLFWGMIRTPPEQRDMAALQKAADETGKLWLVLDERLRDRAYVEGETFTLADIVLGAYCRRYLGDEMASLRRPSTPHLQAWYERLHDRPAFRQHIAPALS
ncbi:glutathione S-transferase family protein [Bordetella genomosp. 13]|uniref:glutathione S-transferase family protein n=1 Tax=Bordetella genomosp. 13 TaxID=463040 RepID=UPI0011AAC1CF|nr:glutathione S-transferase family protein [Bordetella genomosp. 13]